MSQEYKITFQLNLETSLSTVTVIQFVECFIKVSTYYFVAEVSPTKETIQNEDIYI